MPSDYQYLDETDVYVTAYWGTISILDILETISHRTQDPDLRAARVHVVDLSLARWMETPPQVMHHEVDRLRPAFAPPRIRTVFVTPGDFFFGLARMYAIVQVVYGAAKVDVYRTWKEASAACGIDLAAAEAWARKRAAEAS